MERTLYSLSDYFDEIDLVYENAKKNETTLKIFLDIEKSALTEAENNCDMFKCYGTAVTKEKFSSLSDNFKSKMIYELSEIGLCNFSASMEAPEIRATLSEYSPIVLGSTMFSILNRIEKLDGTYNMIFPKASLVIEAPFGGKKGLVKLEMMVMLLYPWLSVREESTNQVAVTADKLSQTSLANKPVPEKTKSTKTSIFKKLY